jgi:hypothetical protein
VEEIQSPLRRIREQLAADKKRQEEEQRRQSELAAAAAAAAAPLSRRVHSIEPLPQEVIQFNRDRDRLFDPTDDRLKFHERERAAIQPKKDEGKELAGMPTKRDDEYEGLSPSTRRRRDKEYRLRRIEEDREKLEREREERLRNVTEKRRERIRKRTSEFRLREDELDSVSKRRGKEALAKVRARRRALEDQARRDEEERLQQQQQQQEQQQQQPRNRWGDSVADPSNFPFQMPSINEGQRLLTKKNKMRVRALTRKRKLELKKERLRKMRETRLALKRRNSLKALQAKKERLLKLRKGAEIPLVPPTSPEDIIPSPIRQPTPPLVVADAVAPAPSPRLVSRGEEEQEQVGPAPAAPAQEPAVVSPLALSPTTTPRLSAQVVLPNQKLMSLRSKLDDREQEGVIGSPEAPVSPASSPTGDSVNRLTSAMGKMGLGNDDEAEQAQDQGAAVGVSGSIPPPPQSPVNKEYNVTIQYTPPSSSTLKRPAVLRVVDRSVSIEIGGKNVELSLQVLSSDLDFNVTQSFDMSTTCRDRNLAPREGVASNFAQSKCIKVAAINAPPELKPLSLPFIINFNSITECDEFKEIVDSIRAGEGDVMPAAEGGKRGNRKHSSRKTRRFIRHNIRRSKKHKSKRSKRY